MKSKPVLLISSKLEPGPELDERIAAVFDLEKGKPYSTDIAAAWLIVEALGAQYEIWHLHHVPADSWPPDGYVNSHWECEFEDGPEMEGETAAHAICVAALHNQYQVTKVWYRS